ncbi:hypothetical protein BC835DRAFT_1309465 [Cytidiella melzeri]|nr:hypothetical protein BC835DRAFT_1309465 [Cytidiella melzeri]
MAQVQAYQQHATKNSATLMPGQTIAVNKYTVQVERYLSQGGFAHVYLVRTATPVYNTTHHVLKRIAVPDEAMLTEVKKEVDIMRILKGHPNIVHLIDAASHRMANGAFEVFILMEFCPGGGIIDMMNRRLRERLTEAEILTIFVDVCEGLAAMHALKPPLLHRDLKVENILQSSPTSYKLCDFGSATPVHKAPANGDELRALQADLDRHTTMQYRAPEMVNLLQRRPIDEKSDVWALGVLLYKLCYYTTPFEERGPLAIQNVNYTIPPYPVYSFDMVTLIGSMLREYGTQRPTVFELLNHVHALRGTRSRYTYNLPPKQLPVPARPSVGSPLQTLSPNIAVPGATATNPLADLVMFKSRSSQLSTSPSKNAGVQARDKVLEAIAPMRRGRPQAATPAAPSPSPSPSKDYRNLVADLKFDSADDRAWKGVRGHKSGMASMSGANTVNLNTGGGDPWGIESKSSGRTDTQPKTVEKNFENNFSALPAIGFGDSFEPPNKSNQTASPRIPPIPVIRPTPSPTPSGSATQNQLPPRDAFEGLGLTTQAHPQQTLGDARRARTGLVASNLTAGTSQSTSNYGPSGLGSSTTTYRPPSTHVPSPVPIPQSHSRPQSPALQPSSWQNSSKMPRRPVELSVEQRFPSLEELDRTFVPSAQDTDVSMLHDSTQPPSTERPVEKPASSRLPLNTPGGGHNASRTGNVVGTPGYGLGEPQLSRHNSLAAGTRFDGTRSQQVTGTAMRESRLGHGRHPTSTAAQPPPKPNSEARPIPIVSRHSRPVQPRRHRSSTTIKASTPLGETARLEVPSAASPALPPRPSPKPEQRDWLTGMSDDEATAPVSQPVLRDSPSKRASYIERSPLQMERPLEALSGVSGNCTLNDFESTSDHKRKEQTQRPAKETSGSSRSGPTYSREPERSRVVDTGLGRRTELKGRQDGRRSPSKRRTVTSSLASTVPGGLKLPGMEPKSSALPLTSPSGLTDNWSPLASPTRELTKDGSSSSDDGPEDLSGFKLGRGSDIPARKDSTATGVESKVPRSRRSGSKGRQSSVHDLVDLWGSSQPPESPSKMVDKRRSAIVTSTSMKQPLPGFMGRVRSSSPQPVGDVSPPAAARPTTPTRMTRPPSRQQQRKVAMPILDSGSRVVGPALSPANVSSPPPATSSRARPQSMFLNPVAKTAPLESSLSSAAKPLGQSIDDKRPRSGRRTSISDMVQRYESFNGSGKPPPPIATKPSVLTKTVSEASTSGLPSPSSAATRFPRLSPESSPVQSKSHLVIPGPTDSKEEPSKPRRSPSPVAAGLPSRNYAYPSRLTTNTTGAGSGPAGKATSEARQQPRSVSPRPHEPAAAPQAQPRRQDTLSVPSEDLRSPSPERPYKGVSKLIDRWQRVVDQNETTDTVPKRGPNNSLRGR